MSPFFLLPPKGTKFIKTSIMYILLSYLFLLKCLYIICRTMFYYYIYESYS